MTEDQRKAIEKMLNDAERLLMMAVRERDKKLYAQSRGEIRGISNTMNTLGFSLVRSSDGNWIVQ